MNRSTALGAALVCLFLAACMFGILFVPNSTSGLTIALVIVLGIVCSISTIVDRLAGRFVLFELIHPICYLNFIYFGAATLYLLYDPTAAYDAQIFPWINVSLVLTILGLLLLLYGYYFMRRFNSPSPRVAREIRGSVWLLVLYFLGFAGQIATLMANNQLNTSGRLTALVSLFAQFGGVVYFPYFLLFHLWFSGRATPQQTRLLFFIVVPLQAVLLYPYLGNKQFCLTLLGLPAVSYFFAKGRVPAKTIAALLVVTVFVVFPFYNTFKFLGGEGSISGRLGKTVSNLSDQSASDYTNLSFQLVGQRMAMINSTAIVIRETGRSVDYQYGRTIALTGISLLIPRFVWPDKPMITIGREFAREFRILPRWNEQTWIAITPVGEWYWNFGVPGVLAGMFLMGMFYEFVYFRLASRGTGSLFGLSAYVSILPTLLGFEGNIAGWIGIVARTLAVYALFYWFTGANRWTARETPDRLQPATR